MSTARPQCTLRSMKRPDPRANGGVVINRAPHVMKPDGVGGRAVGPNKAIFYQSYLIMRTTIFCRPMSGQEGELRCMVDCETLERNLCFDCHFAVLEAGRRRRWCGMLILPGRSSLVEQSCAKFLWHFEMCWTEVSLVYARSGVAVDVRCCPSGVPARNDCNVQRSDGPSQGERADTSRPISVPVYAFSKISTRKPAVVCETTVATSWIDFTTDIHTPLLKMRIRLCFGMTSVRAD